MPGGVCRLRVSRISFPWDEMANSRHEFRFPKWSANRGRFGLPSKCIAWSARYGTSEPLRIEIFPVQGDAGTVALRHKSRPVFSSIRKTRMPSLKMAKRSTYDQQ